LTYIFFNNLGLAYKAMQSPSQSIIGQLAS